MKLLPVKELNVPPGQEFLGTQYPTSGAYFVNGNCLVVKSETGSIFVANGFSPSFFKEEASGGQGGGISAEFVFRLIDRTQELLERPPRRAIRYGDIVKGRREANEI